MRLAVPDPALVLLVGPSGAGKSTFAGAHFRPTEIVSSDATRAMLADYPSDQEASAEAFHVLAIVINGRLRRRLMTVVDATNLRAASRKRYRRLADRYGIPSVVVAFDMPAEVYAAHNRRRPDRLVDEDVVAAQTERMRQAMADMPTEGYAALHVLGEPEARGAVSVDRMRRP